MALTPLSADQMLGAESGGDLDEYAERILDAAEAEFRERGIRRTSLEQIAHAAGVSHMTLYRRFGNRDALLSAVFARQGQRFLESVEEVVRGGGTAEERFVLGALTAARLLTGDTLIKRVLEIDRDSVLPVLTTEADSFLTAVRVYLADVLRDGQRAGMPISGDIDQMAEVLVRMAHSTMLSPVTAFDEGSMRRFVEHNLLAMLYGRS